MIAPTPWLGTLAAPLLVLLVATSPARADSPTPPLPAAAAPATPAPSRHIGVQFGLVTGVLVLDASYGNFYGFLSGSIGAPVFCALNRTSITGGATVAPGLSFDIGDDSRWRFDLFLTGSLGYYGHTDYGPHREASNRTDFDGSVGLGIGFHFTAIKGFTVGFRVPVVGFAFGDDVVSLKTSGAYHYLNALLSFPLATLGYRFY